MARGDLRDALDQQVQASMKMGARVSYSEEEPQQARVTFMEPSFDRE